MVAPVAWALSAGGATALRAALSKGGSQLLSRVGTRLSMAAPTVDKVVTLAKKNPMTTALVAYELGDAGTALVQEAVKASKDAAKLIDALTGEEAFDPAPSKELSLENLAAYQNEMEAIDRAATRVGGVDQLLNLRRVLMMDESFFVLHQQLRILGRRR